MTVTSLTIHAIWQKSRTGMPAADILYERQLRVEIDRRFKPVCEKVVGNITCDPNALYRTIDGTCNNLRYPDWGAADIVQQRYLPAEYRDGK
ncbi:hypothetical protein KUTeg_014674 [Tegillarca granosa]|uniref:Uncharacterized protein n=1 Tax=Tegillarca granosa TaxID=220873 RepID=A0ABQ9EUZ7_TEGGR|nr:hypothetical protein KUTeg_014674 [Tegillarca granosa]